MGKPYSEDLCERVVSAVLRNGLSRTRAAAQFGVGISTAIKYASGLGRIALIRRPLLARCLGSRAGAGRCGRFLDHINGDPKPFTWTKDPNKIIAAVKRGHQVLDAIH